VARAKRPSLVVIAGPNGAGKSTLAPVLLQEALAVHNFFQMYLPLATTWRIYDSSRGRMPELVAVGNEATTVIYDEALWARARREANHGS
jgi:predicted ABC-type ATPase